MLKTLHLIPMGIDPSFDPNPILARVRPMLANRSHGVLTSEGTTAIRHFPPTPSSERTDSSRDSGARQRAPVGDSLNDEQWSNDLSIPPSHIRQPVQEFRMRESTNLNLCENRDGQIRGFVVCIRSN